MSTNCLTSGVCLLVRYEVACGTLYTPIALSKNSARKSNRDHCNKSLYKVRRRDPSRRTRRRLPGCLLESGLRLLDEEVVAGIDSSAVAPGCEGWIGEGG